MTQFQESVSVRKLVPSERAFTAPFIAITAGLVVVLVALAVTSFVFAGRPAEAALQGGTDTAAIDGWMPAAIAAGSQHRLGAAQQLDDGWAAALVPQRTSTATDGWEAALIRPNAPAVDGYIQKFLIDD
jgi:hypothetical protein